MDDVPLTRLARSRWPGGLALGIALLLGTGATSPSGRAERVPTRVTHSPAEPLRRQSPAYGETRSALPATFDEYETRRFVVFSDADRAWTLAQAHRLERTYHQFTRWTRSLGIEREPLRHKLVAVLFTDRAGYRTFAREHDHVTDPWIAGYYAPRTDRVVFYHGDANPSVVEARAKLQQMREDIDAILARHEKRVAQRPPSPSREPGEQYRRHLEREEHRVTTFARQVTVATTVHEAVHQLLFHTGVQSPAVQYPLWVSEGLATAFETGDPDMPFGPDREFEPRRGGFAQLLGQERLFPLRRLVTWTVVPGDDEDTIDAVYHQSYALVTWMHHFRRDELRSYLELMRTHAPADEAGYRRVFEEAFGAIDALERSWLKWERQNRRSDEPTTTVVGGHPR